MTRWRNYLAKRESRKKARKNTAEWVPHLSQMSNDEIILELLVGDITPSYRAQLDVELGNRRGKRTNRLIVSTLIFSVLSTVFAFVGLLCR